MTDAKRKERFFTLMRRFVQLGAMLEKDFDMEVFDPDDAEDVSRLASAEMIIAEMNKTRALIEEMMELEQALRS